MIQIKKVMDELSSKTKELNDNLGGKKGVIRKLQSRILFLKMVVAFLETGPTDEFLKGEIGRLSARYKKIMDLFPAWTPTQYFEKEKDKLREFEKLNDIPKLRMQTRALRYIADC
jgi:hypothetical protein